MAEKKISLDLEINKGGSDKTVKSIKTELREAKEEAIALARKFGELSPEATNAAKKLASLKDEMGDLNDKVAGLNPDKFARLSTLTNGVVRGFQAASGAAVLFGKTGEDIEKTIAKLQATMAFADGIQGVMDARKSFVAFGQDVVLGAKKMVVAVQGFSKASKIALAATGIGLIVVALAAIVTYWDEITVAMQGANSEQAKSEKLYEDTKKELNNQLQTHKDTHAQQLLSGKTEREILETEIKITEQLIAQEELKLSIQEKELKKAVADREKLGKSTAGLIYMYGMWKTPEEVKAAGDLGLVEQKKSIEVAKENLAKSKLEIQTIDKTANDKAISDAKKTQEQIDADKNEANDENLRVLIKRRDKELATQKNLAKMLKEVQEEINKSDKEVKLRQAKDIDEFNQTAIKGVEDRNNKVDELNKKHKEDQLAKQKAYEESLESLKYQAVTAGFELLRALNQEGDNATEAAQKKAFERNKAMAIAETVITTYQAAALAYKNGLQTGDVTQTTSILGAAVAVAQGLAKLVIIKKQTFKGSGATSTSGGGGGGGSMGIQAPQTGFTQIRQPQNPNQPQQKQPPVKVFVVQKDIQEATIAADRITAKAVVK